MGPEHGQRGAALGRAIREWRTANGYTREEMADLVTAAEPALNTDGKTVERWEKGIRRPLPIAQRALARVMNRPVAELAALVYVDEQVSEVGGRIGPEEEQDTERRTFLLALGAGAAGMIDYERLASPAVDPAWIADAEAVSLAVANVRSNVAPASLAPAVLGHLSGLESRLPDTSELTARTALLAGSLLVKAGSLGQAWRCYSLAHSLSRDVTVQAKALNGMAGVYVRQGVRDVPVGAVGPTPDMGRALALQEQAASLLSRGPARASAGIVARLAEMRAESGDDAGAMRDLETAERQIGRDGYEWWFLSPEEPYQLGAYRGSALALLGRHREAVAEYDWTLDRMPTALATWRATIAADRDRALAAQ